MDTNFTAKEKVLVHILKNSGNEESYTLPEEITQEGIAKNVGLKQNTVSYAVRKLVEEGMLREETRRIKGKKQKRKAYFLTEEGLEEAKKTKEKINETEVEVVYDSESKLIKIGEINAFFHTNFSLLEILQVVEEEGVFSVDEDEDKDESFQSYYYNKPKTEVKSSDELKKTIKHLKEGEEIVSIVGEDRSGKSLLLSRLAEKFENRHDLFYFKVEKWHEPMHFWYNLRNFLEKCGRHRLSSYTKTADELNRKEWLNNLLEDTADLNPIFIIDDLNLNDKIFGLIEDIIEAKEDDDPSMFVYSKVKDSDLQLKDERCIEVSEEHDPLEELKEHYDASEEVETLMDILQGYVTDEEFWSLALLSVLRVPVEKGALTQLRPVSSKMVDNLMETPLIFTTTDGRITLDLKLSQIIAEQLDTSEKRWLHEIAARHFEDKPSDDIPVLIQQLYHLLKAEKIDKFGTVIKENEEELLNSGFYHSIINLIEELEEKQDAKQFLRYVKGEAYRKKLDYEKAVKIYEQIVDNIEEDELVVRSYIGKAKAEEAQGEILSAIESYKKAKAEAENMQQESIKKEFSGEILFRLGSLLNEKGRYTEAEELLSDSIDVIKEDDHSLLTNAYFVLARMKKLRGDWEESITNFQKGLDHWKKIKGTYQRVGGLKEIGSLYSILRELKNAEEYLKDAVDTSERFGYYNLKASALLSLTECYLEKRKIDEAIESAEEAREILDELGNDKDRALAHTLLSKALLMNDELDEAESKLTKAISIYQKEGLSYRLGLAYFSLAKIQERKENKQGIAENYRKAILSFSGSGANWMAEEVEKEMENIPISM